MPIRARNRPRPRQMRRGRRREQVLVDRKLEKARNEEELLPRAGQAAAGRQEPRARIHQGRDILLELEVFGKDAHRSRRPRVGVEPGAIQAGGPLAVSRLGPLRCPADQGICVKDAAAQKKDAEEEELSTPARP